MTQNLDLNSADPAMFSEHFNRSRIFFIPDMNLVDHDDMDHFNKYKFYFMPEMSLLVHYESMIMKVLLSKFCCLTQSQFATGKVPLYQQWICPSTILKSKFWLANAPKFCLFRSQLDKKRYSFTLQKVTKENGGHCTLLSDTKV